MPTIENKSVYFKSEPITTALRHVPVAENTRKLLRSRIKSPGIHLSGWLNAPCQKLFIDKKIPFCYLLMVINHDQSSIHSIPSHASMPPFLNPIPTEKKCCRVQMFNNSKVHSFLIFHFLDLLIVQLVDNHSPSFACTLPSAKSFFCSLLPPSLWSA